MVLWSAGTHNITLRNLTLFRPRVPIRLRVTANVIEFSIRLKNWKHSHGIEIRSRDSIIIPLMIAEKIESAFSLFHYESLLSKV